MLAPFSFLGGGAGIDAQAQAHYDRVIADNGVIPSGLDGVNNFFKTVKDIYGTSDITTAISVGLDAQVLGYKLGAGAGTTAGQAAQKLYSCSGSSGDVVQTTFAASQPLLLVHSGANYWWSGGNLTGVISAPNITIPTASGMSIEAKVLFTTNDDLVNSGGWICSNDDGGLTRSMFLGFSGSRTLVLYWANLSRAATATAQIPSAFNGWVKATLETSGGDMLAKFFTSLDGITYTQLGSTITNSGGANTFQTSPATFWVTGNGGANNILGKIFRVIYKDANEITRADFNPNQYNAATSQTKWTSTTTGEEWNINTGTATTGYKGVLVDRTIVQGDGIDDFIVTSTINSQQYYTSFVAATLYTNPNTAPRLLSGNGDSHLIFKTGTNAFEAFNGLQMAFTGESINTSLMWIVDYNSTNSKTWINNANETSGSTGTNTSNRLSLFGGVTGATLSNATISTIVRPTALANNTQRTAMYNYIKSINNNAF
jgi:hypothetical protein